MAFTSTAFLRPFVSVLTTSMAVIGFAAISATPAQAATAAGPQYNVVDRPASAVTADALPTVQIDGVVWDQAIAGDTVFAGGQFANARPAGAAAGTNLTPRGNLLSFNIRTGVLNTGFAPNVDGRIRAMTLSPDKSRLYIVGSFLNVNGQARNHIAAFNVSDGSLVAGFAPNVNGEILAAAVTNTAVYFGGTFGTVNGVTRKKLAAVSPTNGATLGWAPSSDAQVNSMTKTPDSSRIIVGGMFANLNNSPTYGLGSLDASSGALYPLAANNVIRDYGSAAAVYSLKSDATNVYGTGYWYGGTAGNFEGPFVMDPYTGAIKSMADCHGDTYDSSVVGTTLYSVSHHHDCSNINGFPDTNPRNRWQRSNAFTVAATTTVGHNTAGGYYDFYGAPAPSLVNWFPDVPAGTYTGQSQGGWTTESTNEYLVQGGEFARINGTAQQGLVRFAVPTLAPKKSGPVVAAADSAPTLRGISGSSVRVSWPANWDRDDQNLTYKLYRTNKTATPLVTQTVTSQFWNRPTQIFTDTGLTPNTAYGYYVVASDPNNNSSKSATTTITTGTTVVDDSNYSKAVQTDGASHYWRLDESAGATTSTDWAGSNDLILGTGVGLANAGAVNDSPDQAASFDGTSNGTAGQTSTEGGTDTFTTESWVKTTSTTGGKIVGFGDSQLGTSSNYDRQVYMDNTGHLVFGVCCTQGTSTLATSGTYNDGAWHQVVGSLSADGMQLYVDGLLEGSNAGITQAQPYAGYWRVGGDNLNGWPYDKTSNFLAATIDDVSVYPTALSATQVRNHYTQSGRTVNIPAEPTDSYGKQVYDDSPSLFWRLNETAGTTVADSSQSRTPGDAFNGVTFGSASTVAPGTAATFNGSDGTVASAKQFANPTNYSEEIWFNTTTSDGGKLIGFGDQRSGRSGNYDRHVYMENSGQLTYGVYTGQTNLITSGSSYNDGQWHHLVATQSSTNGMALYVDGVPVGTNPQTQAQPYTGYWRVGGDSSWGGNSSFFNGTLDEAAVYPYALTQTQIRAHYQASAAAVNTAPIASFTTSCTDASCYLDGSASSDPDGSIASYAWTFGDGGTATTATATHAYAASGTYPVTLTVTDNGGKSTSVSHDVTVTVPPKPNVKPTAAFTSACTDLDCSFDAAGSTDSDGTIASYGWDFGDGATATGTAPSHTFAAGTFIVTLVVTDNQGATDTVAHTVTVQPANQAPAAAFTATSTGLQASFDATSSADPDGTIASYAWTFGDGATGTGAKPSHTYADPASYDVTLTVTDNRGGANSVTHPVTVTAPPNQKPTASFTSTTSDLKVSVNGGGSTDPDGTVASYAWDYGDSSTGTGSTDSHTYAAAGTYQIKLTVTDNKGATDSTTTPVTVTAPPVSTVVAKDTFNRTGSKWGSADTGGSWTDSGASYFATNGSKGQVTVTKAGGGPTASLNSVSVRDSTTTVEFSSNKAGTGGGTYLTLSSRRIGTSEYRLSTRLMPDGSVRLGTAVIVSGSQTTSKEVVVPNLTYAPGDVLKVSFSVTGTGTTTLSGKVWKVSAAEPGTAQVTSTSSEPTLQAAGSVAIQGYLSASATNAPVVLSLDNYAVNRIN